MKIIGPLHRLKELALMAEKLDETKILAAKALISAIRSRGSVRDLRETEFKVFSQWGDDGIIQYLVSRLDIPPERRRFIEFGVQDYTESNTRFLLVNDNWTGLVLDCGRDFIDAIRRDRNFWRYDLTAVHARVTTDNVNELLRENGFSAPVGILSIDVDGNDYWIWKAIRGVEPLVVIVEYNGLYGPVRAVTVPYDPEFDRARAHYSHLYWGTSLKALCLLAREKVTRS